MLGMNRRNSTILGFLVAPLVSAVLLTGVAGGNIGYVSSIGLLPATYVFALGVALLIGLPAYLLINRFGKITWWSALLVGVFCGIVGSITYRLPNELRIVDFYLMVPIGGLSALVFWVIWRWGKPRITIR
jgi:hypothetical protein